MLQQALLCGVKLSWDLEGSVGASRVTSAPEEVKSDMKRIKGVFFFSDPGLDMGRLMQFLLSALPQP